MSTMHGRFLSAGFVVSLFLAGLFLSMPTGAQKADVKAVVPALTELQQTKATLMRVEMDNLEKQKQIAKMASDLATCQQQQLSGVMRNLEPEFLKQLGVGADKQFDWSTMTAVPKSDQKTPGTK